MSKKSAQTSISAKLAKVYLPKPPAKPKNIDQRKREYLTNVEVKQLRKAAASIGRHSLRDETLILLMFRHALRVSEIVALRWKQVDLKNNLLHVRRLKNGLPSTHPIRRVERQGLRQLQWQHPSNPYVFISERQTPLSSRTVHNIIARAGQKAALPFTIHPHMLRHSAGFYLAHRGHDLRAIQSYMGHANIKNTVIYTELSPNRFKDFWQD